VRRLLASALLVVAVAALVWPAGPSLAQDEPQALRVEIRKPGGRDLPLALPAPVGSSGTEADEFLALLQRDMDLSGYFRLVDPDAYIEPHSAGPGPGEFQFEDWDVPGAVVLAKTTLEPIVDGWKLSVWVYDVPGRRKLGGRSFTGTTEQLRTLGHRAANEIVRQVTGEPGVFDTRFAAVRRGRSGKEIVLVDVDGHRVVPVTRNGSINLQPAWSPSGGLLAYTSYRAGNPDLYVADLAAGRTRRISARDGLNAGAAWAPNGQRLALTLSAGPDSDVHIIHPDDGRRLRQVTEGGGIDVSPTFSPDGRFVAHASERAGGLQIYIVPAAGGGRPQRVSMSGSENTDPSWSPRGDSLAYVSRDGRFDIFVAQLSDGAPTGRVTRITQHQGNNEEPTWSPDGRYLAFSSDRSGTSEIWLSTADGHHQVQVTHGGGFSSPAWSPRLSW
jgi:TolB protein